MRGKARLVTQRTEESPVRPATFHPEEATSLW